MIRLIKPYISFEEVEAEFRAVFESGIFTRGAHVATFADCLAQYTGAKHVFLTTSATTALTMCLRVLGVGPGDEVVVSDFSFPASANVVEDVGARPVFADVSLETFNLTAAELERKITPRTKAVIFVDALGNPSHLDEVAAVCKRRGIPLIEDAACGLGSAVGGHRCGAIADLTCFSFHPRKLLTTGEGGAILTGSETWAEKLKVKLNHGATPIGDRLDFSDFGYNYRLPDLQCIMGIRQVKKLDQIIASRSKIRERYRETLEPLDFQAQVIAPGCRSNFQSVVFRVPAGRSRDQLISRLREKEIESTIGTYCLSACTYYKNRYDQIQPNALQLERTTITLPCFEGLDVRQVTAAVVDWAKGNA